MRVANEWKPRGSDAAIIVGVVDYGNKACAAWIAGKGYLAAERAGQLCSIICDDFMAPFARRGADDFLNGFASAGFGRKFGHYLKNKED